MEREFYEFAIRFDLGPNEALWIPAVFDRCGAKVEMSRQDLVQEAKSNLKLAQYLVDVIKRLAGSEEGIELYQEFLAEREV
tara:strand:- start:342 stop:584 length:243 start_codon:yes stop_codon:yes gene_type:complete